jgi:hypothetical protein
MLGAAFAGSHNPSRRKLIKVTRIKNRFGFMHKIISGFSYTPEKNFGSPAGTSEVSQIESLQRWNGFPTRPLPPRSRLRFRAAPHVPIHHDS